jgi:outer membrane receptor protein involved in Fe transport
MVPNIPGPTLNYFLQNGSMTYPWDKGSARMDHQLTSKDTINFFFMKAENADTPGAEGVPGLKYPYETGPGLWTRKQTYGRFTWNRMITPHILSSTRFNKMKNMSDVYSASCTYPDNNWAVMLGLKNIPGPDRCLPAMTMTTYSTWGYGQWGNDDGWDWAIAEDMTYVRGSHTFKGGGYYTRDDWAGGGNHKPDGAYGFSQLATAIPGDQSQNTGNAFASMLLGYTDNASMEGARREFFKWKHFGGYFQDDWRVNAKLTLNVGLRYDFTFAVTGGGVVTGFKDAKDPLGFDAMPSVESGFSNFDPKLPNPGAGGLPGAFVFTGKSPGRTGSTSPFDSWPWAFQPRLGLAYNVRPGTVLRTSFGRTFQDVKNQGGTTHFDGFINTLSWASSDLDVRDFPMMLDNGLPPWNPPPPC